MGTNAERPCLVHALSIRGPQHRQCPDLDPRHADQKLDARERGIHGYTSLWLYGYTVRDYMGVYQLLIISFSASGWEIDAGGPNKGNLIQENMLAHWFAHQ